MRKSSLSVTKDGRTAWPLFPTHSCLMLPPQSLQLTIIEKTHTMTDTFILSVPDNPSSALQNARLHSPYRTVAHPCHQCIHRHICLLEVGTGLGFFDYIYSAGHPLRTYFGKKKQDESQISRCSKCALRTYVWRKVQAKNNGKNIGLNAGLEQKACFDQSFL